MRKIKVKIGFSNYSQSKFFFVASNIKTKMTGNPSFPSPTPNPDSLTEPLAAYGTLLEKGRTCTQAEIAAKEQLRVQITAILQSLGAFVQESGNNDRAILLTTGYELSEEP